MLQARRSLRLWNRLNETTAYPLLFEPVLKPYVWGGRNLERLFGRDLPPGVIAESWEIAAHRDGASTIANGPQTGLTLTELHGLMGLDLIGHHSNWAQERNRFPLLVKLLDARDRLSVQVHPGDDYAQKHAGDLGKTEMWVVLHAKPDAEIILGLRSETAPELFRKAIAGGQVEQYLFRRKVSQGDFICVPSGSLHAILGGLVLAEIQQNSNVTYRVYDWGRRKADRPLHIDEALAVINFEQVKPPLPIATVLAEQQGIRQELLCRNKYFTVQRLQVGSGSAFEGRCDGRTMEIWGVIHGRASVTTAAGKLSLSTVSFSLFPAVMGGYKVEAEQDTTALRILVEDLSSNET